MSQCGGVFLLLPDTPVIILFQGNALQSGTVIGIKLVPAESQGRIDLALEPFDLVAECLVQDEGMAFSRHPGAAAVMDGKTAGTDEGGLLEKLLGIQGCQIALPFFSVQQEFGYFIDEVIRINRVGNGPAFFPYFIMQAQKADAEGMLRRSIKKSGAQSAVIHVPQRKAMVHGKPGQGLEQFHVAVQIKTSVLHQGLKADDVSQKPPFVLFQASSAKFKT